HSLSHIRRAAAQGEHQQAHSRRHVIIIVSVVVQWCGADLHSEENGEQQRRREVRQTHTEGKPHKTREQQPGVHRTPHTTHDTHSNPRQQAHTNTHSHAARTTHRWRRERPARAAHKAPPHVLHMAKASVVSAPLTDGLHAKVEAQRPQQQKSNETRKKQSPHTTRIHFPR
ncbi:hypothetical protein TcCL_Unassigned00275, partial [Trypanosoma cruzi]